MDGCADGDVVGSDVSSCEGGGGRVKRTTLRLQLLYMLRHEFGDCALLLQSYYSVQMMEIDGRAEGSRIANETMLSAVWNSDRCAKSRFSSPSPSLQYHAVFFPLTSSIHILLL
jgi:hypothetical protein